MASCRRVLEPVTRELEVCSQLVLENEGELNVNIYIHRGNDSVTVVLKLNSVNGFIGGTLTTAFDAQPD
jgi:hypothetical protein